MTPEITEQNSAEIKREQLENNNKINNNTLENKSEVSVREEELKKKDINVSIESKYPQRFKPGQSGNPKGRPKGTFSIRQDLIKSLKRIKRKKPELYQKIIDSYWEDGKMRQFLLEIVDGKARQSMELTGTMENPVRIIEIKPMEEPQNEAK